MSGMHWCQYYPPTSDRPNAPWNRAKAKKGKHVCRFHFLGQIQLSPELIPFLFLQKAFILFLKLNGCICADKQFSPNTQKLRTLLKPFGGRCVALFHIHIFHIFWECFPSMLSLCDIIRLCHPFV